jgi:hypothetical protein
MPDPARATANQAHVRRLLAARQPPFAAQLARAEAALDAEMAQASRGAGQHPGRPAAPRPGHRRQPVPPGRLAAAPGGRLSGPRHLDPEPGMEAGP